MNSNSHIEKQDGVYISKTTRRSFSDFENHYIKVRDKEQRVLSIEEIKQLPDLKKEHIHYKEWQVRKKSIVRFLDYLSQKKAPLKIVDIGCGNGFLTNLMSLQKHHVVAVDVNLTELKQASEAFANSGITWYYLDVLNESLPETNFDVITFFASFQYFKDPNKIIDRCLSLLNEQGEIHILDSPFYSTTSKAVAQERSKNYYESMNVREMEMHYNHNTFDVLNNYSVELKYNPNTVFRKLFKREDSPFPWIKITKVNSNS